MAHKVAFPQRQENKGGGVTPATGGAESQDKRFCYDASAPVTETMGYCQ